MKSKKLNIFFALLIFSTWPIWAKSKDSTLPTWAKKIISKTNFSFIKTAKACEFNDFDYFEKSESAESLIPQKVRATLQREAGKDFKDLIRYNVESFKRYNKSGEQEVPDPRKIYSTIYAFKGPANILVYALHVNGWGGVGDAIGNSYCFILYDSKRELVAPNPIWISTRWGTVGTDRPDLLPIVVKPLISFEDITGDGDQVFVVEDINHNGTANAVLYHYYAIRPDFTLAEVLDLETRFSLAGDWWDKGYESLNRKIIARRKNQLTIGITLEGLNKDPVQVGSMILKRKGLYSSFAIDQKLPKMKTDGLGDPYHLGTNFFEL